MILTGLFGNIVWLFDGDLLALGRAAPYRWMKQRRARP